MAFNRKNLANCGGNGASGHLFKYLTTDDPATIDTAGYMNDAHRELQVGDLIHYSQVDNVDAPTSLTDSGWFVVNSNANGVVDLTNETAATTTDTD